MKATKIALAAVLLALLSSGSAYARGHHGGHGARVGIGVAVGVPLWYGAAYYPPYYYPPYFYAPDYYPQMPDSPPMYIEQGDAQPAPASPPQAYWYYCADAKGYFPYVKECPGGWQRVSPQPPPG